MVVTAAVGLAGVPLPGNLPSEARLRVFICHECGTTEPVSWCGQRPDCGHSDCIDALEKCAAAHRDPLDPRRFHGPVNLAQIDEHLTRRPKRHDEAVRPGCRGRGSWRTASA